MLKKYIVVWGGLVNAEFNKKDGSIHEWGDANTVAYIYARSVFEAKQKATALMLTELQIELKELEQSGLYIEATHRLIYKK